MYNEIGRKITSLTLITIMLAGGMTIAAPGIMPEAFAANANLFVSAENSQFDNYMSGPQVIEVKVINSDINETNESKGEPDVTVNGNTLRMVQASDGNWYGYFASSLQASIADATADRYPGSGLDFGTFCNRHTDISGSGEIVSVTETVGIYVGVEVTTDDDNLCTDPLALDSALGIPDYQNVIREEKDINGFPSPTVAGQIGIDPLYWPFIQVYDLAVGGNVDIEYNAAGGVQSTSLTFDTVEGMANLELDRTKYPDGAQVHAEITDLWLNIDPTDKDSWTFNTNVGHEAIERPNGLQPRGGPGGVFYQVFNENGANGGQVINIQDSLSSLMCVSNCKLLLEVDTGHDGIPVVTLQDNADTILVDLLTRAGGSTELGANNASIFGVLNHTADAADGVAGNPILNVGSQPVTITELSSNSGVFGTYDEGDISVLRITDDPPRDSTATLTYNEDGHSIRAKFDTAVIDIKASDDEWNSGEKIPFVLIDADANKNSRADEDLVLSDPSVSLIPAITLGDPFTLGEGARELRVVAGEDFFTTNGISSDGTGQTRSNIGSTTLSNGIATVETFSERAIIEFDGIGTVTSVDTIILDLDTTIGELRDSINDNRPNAAGNRNFTGFNLFNYDFRSLGAAANSVDVYLVYETAGNSGFGLTADSIIDTSGLYFENNTNAVRIVEGGDAQDYVSLDEMTGTLLGDSLADELSMGLLLEFSPPLDIDTISKYPIVADFFSFGFNNDGRAGSDRVANQIIRIEAEETGDNTSTFIGTLEYTMINQLNINDLDTYLGISTIADDPDMIIIEDFTDEDDVRVTYLDLGEDGVSTQISDQQAAPSHSGVVSFDSDSYKTADTVIITVDDLDLNVDSEIFDIYTIVTAEGDANIDVVGSANELTDGAEGTSVTLSNGDELGRLLDVTFDDALWTKGDHSTCFNSDGTTPHEANVGFGSTGFTLGETEKDSGRFSGSFQIPAQWCHPTNGLETATGLDIEVNYVDFRDASGEIIEVGDSAGVRANTGSVSLDRTVYPVPFGTPADFERNTSHAPDIDNNNRRSVFPIHQSGTSDDGTLTNGLDSGEFLNGGDLTIHVRINDPDWDVSGSGEDIIAYVDPFSEVGPVKVSVIRGSDSVVLTYAGGVSSDGGVINVGDQSASITDVPEFGPISEIAPDAGIFEADIAIRYTDGPASPSCPTTGNNYLAPNGTGIRGDSLVRFNDPRETNDYCILQGDILQVEYTDPTDASGDVNTVTDSATFDLRNGVLQSDKSVYIIGSDMILTLIEPDLDLDNDQAETYDLDLIEWDSDAATVSMGDAGGEGPSFDPEPLDFRETGDSTGIFQIVVEIPESLGGDPLERGEEILLEYTDWGPSGSDYVGDEDEDVNLTLFTSNFGATVDLDQKVYSWTDKVYITIVAPDHNFDSDLVDAIGETERDPVTIATRGNDLDQYRLVETGTDTGIFTGEVILTGFEHDADGVPGIDTQPRTTGDGPTNGFLQADDDDGLTISFEFSEDETVVGSALIRWNIGEVQWLEASYPATGTGVVRVIDPDVNLDPEAVDNFDVDVWSDSDSGGIDLTVTETNEATGIFEGTVFFTLGDKSEGHRLRVAEGDTVTVEYEDNTLPDPYSTADELEITATTLIGTVVPPLERAVVSNLRPVDSFDNSLDAISVDQQVQVTADLASGQDKDQEFAYLVQIQDGNGVTVSLSWIAGSLAGGQSFSPSVSWTPTDAGIYKITAFAWESLSNPTALSPPVSTDISVS